MSEAKTQQGSDKDRVLLSGAALGGSAPPTEGAGNSIREPAWGPRPGALQDGSGQLKHTQAHTHTTTGHSEGAKEERSYYEGQKTV